MNNLKNRVECMLEAVATHWKGFRMPKVRFCGSRLRSGACPVAVVSALLSFHPGVLGQGIFEFSGKSYSSIIGDWEYLSGAVLDRDGVTTLSGSGFSAQLYVGPLATPDDQLVPAGTIRSLAYANGWLAALGTNRLVVVPGVPAGSRARAQMRVWDNAGGTFDSWEAAGVRGVSASFDTGPLGDGQKTSNPSLSFSESFQLLPAVERKSPGTAQLLPVYQNLPFPISNPDNPPGGSTFVGFSRDGNAVTLFFAPPSSFGTYHNPELLGTILYRRTRSETNLVDQAYRLTRGAVMGVSDDGRVGFRNGSNGAFLVRSNVESNLSLRYIETISADSHFVFGFATNDDYIRVNTTSLESRKLFSGGTYSGYGTAQCTPDGRAALLSGYRRPPMLWREDAGIEVIDVPATFVATGISDDLKTIAGSIGTDLQIPAYWTAGSGVTVMNQFDSTVSGSLHGVSADGRIFYGEAEGMGGAMQFWTRDGKGYGVAELLPNGAASELKGWNGIAVTAISSDGHSAFITAQQPVRLSSSGSATAGWIVDLVFPGEGPRLSMSAHPDGNVTVEFPTQVGYRYQLESGLTPATWTQFGDAVTGDGTVIGAGVTTSDRSRVFRVSAEAQP